MTLAESTVGAGRARWSGAYELFSDRRPEGRPRPSINQSAAAVERGIRQLPRQRVALTPPSARCSGVRKTADLFQS